MLLLVCCIGFRYVDRRVIMYRFICIVIVKNVVVLLLVLVFVVEVMVYFNKVYVFNMWFGVE